VIPNPEPTSSNVGYVSPFGPSEETVTSTNYVSPFGGIVAVGSNSVGIKASSVRSNVDGVKNAPDPTGKSLTSLLPRTSPMSASFAMSRGIPTPHFAKNATSLSTSVAMPAASTPTKLNSSMVMQEEIEFFAPFCSPSLSSSSLCLEAFPVSVVAEQICLIDYRLFAALDSREFVDCNWMKRDKYERSPNILNITKRFNELSNFVVKYVLMKDVSFVLSQYLNPA
jgi:hypothetical protein